MRTDTIVIPDVSGRCRWCQCTNRAPCASACSWVNPQRSLCSSCEDINAQARTPSGRRFLARLLQPIMAAAAAERRAALAGNRARGAALRRTKAGRAFLAQLQTGEPESGT